MCGITGFFNRELISHHEGLIALDKMLSKIESRGPDGQGSWFENGMYLGHRRLAIHDLSPEGSQPMVSPSGRYVLVFNGEIYNYKSIKCMFPNVNWRGSSDTEVMLLSIDKLGVDKTVEILNGMFAFAVLDRKTGELTLGRDRVGEKPLYYICENGKFAFSSDIRSLSQLNFFEFSVDRCSLIEQSEKSYISEPYTIYESVRKLKPGSLFIFKPFQEPVVKTYWSLANVARDQQKETISDYNEAVEKLEDLVKDSVRLRMEADVPLGAFLSGGVDSSLVVGVAQSFSEVPLETFSVGFESSRYNEAPFARDVASYLGTNHNEILFSSSDIRNLIPDIAHAFDEPFSDTSQLPMLMLSKYAKEKVTVSLSGDGGDELFCGYNRYKAIPEIWSYVSMLPLGVRSSLAKLASNSPLKLLDFLFFFFSKRANSYGRKGKISHKIKRLSSWVDAEDISDFYTRSMSSYPKVNLVLPDHRGNIIRTSCPQLSQERSFSDRELMMLCDSIDYLPNDILNKLDRTSMAVGLEGRIPLLDHRIVEFAWSLPIDMKYQNGVGKKILRDVLYKYVPKHLIERPKVGFGVPIDDWLRTELRDWATDMLSSERIRRQGFYDHKVVYNLLSRHLSGQENNGNLLWNLLMAQVWIEAN